MNEGSGVYFYKKRGGRRRSHRAAGVLVITLLLLTAGICLLVVFLPKLAPATGSASATAFGGKTFYALATAEETQKVRADEQAKLSSDRGGAGYIYNDGAYRVIAALYARESDAKTLASVNADSHYFALAIPAYSGGAGDKKLLDYLTGEWFDSLYAAANELDRGNTVESSAQHAVSQANAHLIKLSFGADSGALAYAVRTALERSDGQGGVLSNIRYLQAGVIVAARSAVS